MKLTHFSKTDVGLVRPANEDDIGSIIDNTGVYTNIYIVCDGMGGHVGGARASQSAVRHIKEYFSNTPDPTPNTALKEAIEFANMQIFADATENTEFKGMGTTVTLMVESDGLLYIAHVGDSRIYINTDKKLVRITKDHSFVQSLVDAGQLTDAQMETHPRKNELTKALGIAIDVDVEVAPQPIRAKKGDKFLLCTDGLCGLINDTRISSIINSNSDLKETVHQLIEDANKAGGHDNISADLIEVTESEFTKSKYINRNNVPVSNTGTRQVFIDPKNDKPIINKKLIQIILSVVLLISLVGGGYLLYEKITPPPAPGPVGPAEPAEKSFEQELSKLNFDETFSEELGIIYVAVGEQGFENYYQEFVDAIRDKNYQDIIGDNKQDQHFFIAKTKEVLYWKKAEAMYRDSNKSFEEGDFIFIKTKYLKLKKEVTVGPIAPPAVTPAEIVENITQQLKDIKTAIEKSVYQNKKDDVPSGYTIRYKDAFGGFRKKGHPNHPNPEGGECTVRFRIKHKDSKQSIEGKYSHSYTATQEHQNKTLFDKLQEILKIEKRSGYQSLPNQHQACIVFDDKLKSKCEEQKDIKVGYTITVGEIPPFTGTFKETIPADKEICYKEEVEELKQDGFRESKLSFDKQIDDSPPKKDLKGNNWFKYEAIEDNVDLYALEIKYNSEMKEIEKLKEKNYTREKSCPEDPNCIWFFESSGAQRNLKEENDITSYTFSNEELKILEKYDEDFKKDQKYTLKTE